MHAKAPFSMKLCRFDDRRYGVVRDGSVFDVTAQVEAVIGSARAPVTGDAFIANLAEIVALIDAAPLPATSIPVASAHFLSPILSPTKIVCAPVNYEAHLAESKVDEGISFNHAVARIDKAGLFLKATSALVGTSEGVAVRFLDRRTDHEIELGIVIGRTCHDVSEADALDFVAGYSIALDMTVRGTEDRSFRKSIDTYAVLGPWLVTADEIADPDNLNFRLQVNGADRQVANTKRLIFGTRKLISWASRWYTLQPGDIIMTGTPEGVGPVEPGDMMQCEMDGIGSVNVAVRAAVELSGSSLSSGAFA